MSFLQFLGHETLKHSGKKNLKTQGQRAKYEKK